MFWKLGGRIFLDILERLDVLEILNVLEAWLADLS